MLDEYGNTFSFEVDDDDEDGRHSSPSPSPSPSPSVATPMSGVSKNSKKSVHEEMVIGPELDGTPFVY